MAQEAPAASACAKWYSLLFWLIVTALAAALGGMASADAAAFYQALKKPAWAPPAGVFGPVWTVLYALMAIAAWRVERAGGMRRAKGPLALYLGQLVLNALWTWLFFRWRLGAWALAEVAVLWLVVFVMVVWFWRVRTAAGVLLVPYLLWLSLAAALTAAVWRLNVDVL